MIASRSMDLSVIGAEDASAIEEAIAAFVEGGPKTTFSY